jgi:hypothetical protein
MEITYVVSKEVMDAFLVFMSVMTILTVIPMTMLLVHYGNLILEDIKNR